MNVPAKGETVTVEGYGTGLFISGPNMDSETPHISLKFEFGPDGDEVISIPWEEFKEKRVYPEQQPKDTGGHDWGAVQKDAERWWKRMQKRNDTEDE